MRDNRKLVFFDGKTMRDTYSERYLSFIILLITSMLDSP